MKVRIGLTVVALMVGVLAIGCDELPRSVKIDGP